MTTLEFTYYLKGKLEGRNRIDVLDIKDLLDKADEAIINSKLTEKLDLLDKTLPEIKVKEYKPAIPYNPHPYNPYCTSTTNQTYTDLEGSDLDIDK